MKIDMFRTIGHKLNLSLFPLSCFLILKTAQIKKIAVINSKLTIAIGKNSLNLESARVSLKQLTVLFYSAEIVYKAVALITITIIIVEPTNYPIRILF